MTVESAPPAAAPRMGGPRPDGPWIGAERNLPGYGQRWIAEIVRRYNAEGADGLGDQRARNTGARPLLGQEDEAALRDALAEPPAEGGLWTGPKVAAWMSQRLDRKVWPQRGWDYLEKLEHSL